MITLHHLEKSRSHRIAWLLEELGVDYDVKIYRRDPETILAPPELTAVHPLGKSPVITDGDITVAESGAIIEYLVDTYDDGTLKPPRGTGEGRQYTYWLHYAEGSFMNLMLVAIIMARIESAPLPFFVRPVAKGIVAKVRNSFINPNVGKHLAFMEQALSDRAWFTGDVFSAADIQVGYALEAVYRAGFMGDDYPALKNFIERCSAREAYARAEERVGKFALPSF